MEGRVLRIRELSGQNLLAKDRQNSSDPYIIIRVNELEFQTETIKDTLNPVWRGDEQGVVGAVGPFTGSDASQALFTIVDWNRFGSHDPMGSVTITLDSLPLGQPVTLTLDVLPPLGDSGDAGTLTCTLELEQIDAGLGVVHAVLPPLSDEPIVAPDSGAFTVHSEEEEVVVFSKGTPKPVVDSFIALFEKRNGHSPKGKPNLVSGAYVVQFKADVWEDPLVCSLLASLADAALIHGYRPTTGASHTKELGLVFEALDQDAVLAFPTLCVTLDEKDKIRFSSLLSAHQGLPGIVASSLKASGLRLKAGLRYKSKNRSWKCDLKGAQSRVLDMNSPNDISACIQALYAIGFVLEAIVGCEHFVFRPFTPSIHRVNPSGTAVPVVVSVKKYSLAVSRGGSPNFYDVFQRAIEGDMEIKSPFQGVMQQGPGKEGKPLKLTVGKIKRCFNISPFMLLARRAPLALALTTDVSSRITVGSTGLKTLVVSHFPQVDLPFIPEHDHGNPVLHASGSSGGRCNALTSWLRLGHGLATLGQGVVDTASRAGLVSLADQDEAYLSLGEEPRVALNSGFFFAPRLSFALLACIADAVRHERLAQGSAEDQQRGILGMFYSVGWVGSGKYAKRIGHVTILSRRGPMDTHGLIPSQPPPNPQAALLLGMIQNHNKAGGVVRATDRGVGESTSSVQPLYDDPPPSYDDGDAASSSAAPSAAPPSAASPASSSVSPASTPAPALPPGWVETIGPDGSTLWLFTPTNTISTQHPSSLRKS